MVGSVPGDECKCRLTAAWGASRTRAISKSFLLLFFKKEVLFSCLPFAERRS
jgi:hypothetical protein